MALKAADLEKAQAVKAKIEELKDEIMQSLPLRATGGSHLANELLKVLPKLDEVIAAIEAELNT